MTKPCTCWCHVTTHLIISNDKGPQHRKTEIATHPWQRTNKQSCEGYILPSGPSSFSFKKRIYIQAPTQRETSVMPYKRTHLSIVNTISSPYSTGKVLRSSGAFGSTWAGWLRLRRLAHCTWSLRFRYSVRADGLWAYGWYRVARAWEISQAYKVFRGGSVCFALQD